MIFDAIVALIIFKFFGEQGLWVLGTMCAITIIRTCVNVNGFFAGMAEYAESIENKED